MMDKFTVGEKGRIAATKAHIKQLVVSSINDPMIPNEIAALLMQSCVVSGGITASVLNNESINDIDLYFKSRAAMDKFKELMTPRVIKSIVKDVDPTYMNGTVAGKMVTSNAYTLLNDLQVIILDTSEAVRYFDFIHCQPYFDISNDKYYISKRQYECITSKKLVYNPNRLLKDTPKRIEKFKARGWTA